MAKTIRKAEKKRRSLRDDNLPLQKQNFVILAIGLLILVAGYLAMSEGSVEGFLPLVVAPILLVIGYCVVIPFGILYKPRAKTPAAEPAPTPSAGQTPG